MKKRLEQLTALFSHIRLREDEQRAMRQEFLAYMDMHPVRAQKVVRHSVWQLFMQRQVVAYVAFVVVAAGGSVSFAAERALPTDGLYVVKKEVNERAALIATAPFAHTHASVHAKLVERRLGELDQLLAAGMNSPETLDDLGEEITARTAEVVGYLETQDTEMLGREDALALGTKLKTALEASEVSLEKKLTTDVSIQELHDDVAAAAARVEQERKDLAEEGTTEEMRTPATTTAPVIE